jgi:hypothetical protein
VEEKLTDQDCEPWQIVHGEFDKVQLALLINYVLDSQPRTIARDLDSSSARDLCGGPLLEGRSPNGHRV